MTALGDVCTVRSSLVDPTRPEFARLPHIAPDSIEKGSGRLLDYRTAGEDGVTSGKYRFEAGDVLYSKIRPNLNKVALVDLAGVCSADMYALDVDRNLATPEYIAHALRSKDFLDYATSLSNRANIPKLNREQLLRFDLHLPPLSEQRRIAAILDHADALRTKRSKVLAHLDALTTSIFDSLFSGDLPTAPLGELAETRLGKMLDAKKQTGEHRRHYLRNANVQWFRFDLEDLLEMDFTEKDRTTFALLPGDVLVCEGGQPGRSAIWRGELDECYFQKALHRVRLGDDLKPEYFAHAMKKIVDSNGLKDFVTSSTIAHLTGEKLRTLPIPVPDLARQREFAARVEQVRRQTEAVTRAAATAADLFGSIQARAFRGEL